MSDYEKESDTAPLDMRQNLPRMPLRERLITFITLNNGPLTIDERQV